MQHACISQKLLDQIAWNFQGWFVIIQGPIHTILGVIWSKVKVKVTQVKNYWTELHEIFRDDLSSSKDHLIRFWRRSGQRSRSRSQKSQKRIFVITRSVSVRFIWNQHQNVCFSIPYPLTNGGEGGGGCEVGGEGGWGWTTSTTIILTVVMIMSMMMMMMMMITLHININILPSFLTARVH